MKCSYCGGKTTEPTCVCCGMPVYKKRYSIVAPDVPSIVPAAKVPQPPIEKKAGNKAPVSAQAKQPAKTADGAKSEAVKKAGSISKMMGPPVKKTDQTAKRAGPMAGHGKKASETSPAKAAMLVPNTKNASEAGVTVPDPTDMPPQVVVQGMALQPQKPTGLLQAFYVWESIQMIVGAVVMIGAGGLMVASFVGIAVDIMQGEGFFNLTMQDGFFSNLLILLGAFMVSLYIFKIHQAVLNRLKNRQISFLAPYYIYCITNILMAFLSYYMYYTSASKLLVYPTVFFVLSAAVSVLWVLYIFVSPQVERFCGAEKSKKQQRKEKERKIV